MSRHPTTSVQLCQRTARPATQVLDDLVMLDVPGAWIAERGRTYLVFSPREKPTYTVGRAVTLAIATVFAILILSSVSVLFIALLPAAVIPLLPLLLEDHPMLAVGAVEDDAAVTTITVHGQAWGELVAAVDAYVAHLPEAPIHEAEPDGPQRRGVKPVAVGAAGSWPGSRDRGDR